MGLWQHGRERRPTQPGQLIHYFDASTELLDVSIRFTECLVLERIRPSIVGVGLAFAAADRPTGHRPVDCAIPNLRRMLFRCCDSKCSV